LREEVFFLERFKESAEGDRRRSIKGDEEL